MFIDIQKILGTVPESEKISYFKWLMTTIYDEQVREDCELQFKAILMGQVYIRKKIVIFVHGIMSHGEWVSTVSSEFVNSGFDCETCKYGYADVLYILLRRLFWKGVYREFSENINNIFLRNRGAEINIVAHSFGTYLVSKLLMKRPILRFNRIIFCGSIVREDYALDHVLRDPSVFCNDVGRRDGWPCLANLFSRDFGRAGRYGFNKWSNSNRTHNLGHSDYFDANFIKTYWIPFLESGQIVPPTSVNSKRDLLRHFVPLYVYTPLVLTLLWIFY